MQTIIRPATYTLATGSESAEDGTLGPIVKSSNATVIDLPEDGWVSVTTIEDLDAEAEAEPERWYKMLMA